MRESRNWTTGGARCSAGFADPEAVEEWKWRGVPVWSHDGLICTGETYKRRAIDFREGEKIDEEALKALVSAAVALNESTARN